MTSLFFRVPIYFSSNFSMLLTHLNNTEKGGFQFGYPGLNPTYMLSQLLFSLSAMCPLLTPAVSLSRFPSFPHVSLLLLAVSLSHSLCSFSPYLSLGFSLPTMIITSVTFINKAYGRPHLSPSHRTGPSSNLFSLSVSLSHRACVFSLYVITVCVQVIQVDVVVYVRNTPPR